MVFVSYSHRDVVWKERLVTHLRVLQAQKWIKIWDYQQAAAGQCWEKHLYRAIELASIAVVLVSPDYLASDFCIHIEMPHVLKRRSEEGLKVVPILIRDCLWRAVPELREIQLFPRDGSAIARRYRSYWDCVFTQIAEEVASLAASSLDSIQKRAELLRPDGLRARLRDSPLR